MATNLWDKIWRDDSGRVVIWQTPNVWLIAWAVLNVISLMNSGRVSDWFSWASHGSLIIWSLLEITKGADYFRRVVGLLVLIFAVFSLVNNI